MTQYILIITAIISVAAFYMPQLMNATIFSPYLVKQKKEYHRFITSGFLHGNWIHLFINMIVLLSFGIPVEYYFRKYFGDSSTAYYLIMYFAAIVISDLPTYFKHKNNVNYASLGASGAVSAVVFASILFDPWNTLLIMGIIPIPAILFGVLYLVYSVRAARQSKDNINHDAHLYGALFGMGFTIILSPEIAVDFLNLLINDINFGF